MAQLGNTTIGATPRGINGTARGALVTMPAAAASGFSVYAYIEDAAPGDNFRAALISDADKITVLAESNLRTDISTAGWYQFSGGDFATYTPSNGETFIIVVASDSAADANAYYDDLGQDGWSASAGISDIDPLTLVDVMNADTARDYSIYLDYTEAGGGPGGIVVNLQIG